MAKIKLDDIQLKNLLPDDLPEYITEQEIIEAIKSRIIHNSLFSNEMMSAVIVKEVLFDVYRVITIYINVDNDIVKDINSTRKKDKLSPYCLDVSAYNEYQQLPFYHSFNGVNRRSKIIEV